jgi:small subunit ribosomal protein S21
MLIIDVKEGNIDKALKKLKRKWQDSKAVEQLRDRKQYTKPSVTKRLEKEDAVRKNLKQIKSTLDFKKAKNIPTKYKKV